MCGDSLLHSNWDVNHYPLCLCGLGFLGIDHVETERKSITACDMKVIHGHGALVSRAGQGVLLALGNVSSP